MKPILVIQKPNSLTKEDKDAIVAEGYMLLEHDWRFKGVEPRLLIPEPEAPSGMMLMAALEAMQGPTDSAVRSRFVEILYREMCKEREPNKESNP